MGDKIRFLIWEIVLNLFYAFSQCTNEILSDCYYKFISEILSDYYKLLIEQIITKVE